MIKTFSNEAAFKDWKVSRDKLSNASSSNSGGGDDDDQNAARKKSIFRKEHYDVIAELLGQKIIYGIMDENDYRIIEAFTEMFRADSPIKFDKDSFKEQVYEAHSRRNDESSTAGT